MQTFKDLLQEDGVEIRTKPLDHLSLAYFKSFPDKHLSTEELQMLEKLAKDIISGPWDVDLQWNLVLQQQVHKSDEIGNPHVFRQVKKWPIRRLT
jgi:hypothetical protein